MTTSTYTITLTRTAAVHGLDPVRLGLKDGEDDVTLSTPFT